MNTGFTAKCGTKLYKVFFGLKESNNYMYLKTFDDMKKTSAFFMLKPVNAIYGFIVTVCLAIVAIIVWALVAPIDDVVKAPVLLRPSQAVSSIKCVTSGELKAKYYENDDIVNSGELLFSLDTSALQKEMDSYYVAKKRNEEDIKIYQTLLQTIETGEIRGVSLDSDAFLKSNSYLLEKSKNEAILEDSLIKLNREKEMPEGLKVPQKIEDLENIYRQTKLSYETWLNNQSIQTNEKLSALKAEENTIESRLSELERAIKNSTIYAPISGRISESKKLNTGDYILSGEEVLRIIPQNSEALLADIYVDPSYIARVKVGALTRLKFPGLAPSRYGMIETKVSLVPPDVSVISGGQTVFIVEALIENPNLKTKQGQTAHLLPGISAEARIVTDRSTAMQMILRKLDFIN